MEVYAALNDPHLPLRDVPAYAQRVERLGFSALLIPEATHDGFLTALLALEHTRTLTVTTSVVVAFPRSPTTTAYAAWDLQALSDGRFQLGLGSQVRGNIEGRFGVAWTPPVERMRDYVGALRAVWSCWQGGGPLRYESESYRLSRMQPFFRPAPIARGEIPVVLGGVNPGMTRLAGEIADGFVTHPTNSSPRYLREVVRPHLRAGAERVGRDPAEVRLLASTFVACGADAAAVAREREQILAHLGFLYSTPQYWPTLDLYGWGEIGRRLQQLVREGRWQDLASAVPATLFDQLVPSGTYDEIGPILQAWYGDLATGITLRMPDDPGADAALGRLVATLAQRSSRPAAAIMPIAPPK
ncbi:MAG: TIGR03617 family F420-dependent LLM class oxidoreductase [Candidatus Binatia bacterium]